MLSGVKPTFFATAAAFRAWLKKHHKTADELWVGYYRRDCGKPSISWQQSVDEALCFGWIDGIRKKVSDEAYTNRFTPRRAGSNWSAINIAKVEELTKQKRMHAAGLAAFAKRTEAKSANLQLRAGLRRVRQTARTQIQGEQEGVVLLPGPAALLPEDHDWLGQRREAGGDAPPPAGQVDGRVREWQALHGMKKYTFADYSFQFITVTAGVLIALLIDGLAETKNNRELVAAAHATIVREVADNLKELEGLPKALEASRRRDRQLSEFANDVLSKGKIGRQVALSCNFNLPQPRFVRLADRRSNWRPRAHVVRRGADTPNCIRSNRCLTCSHGKSLTSSRPPPR